MADVDSLQDRLAAEHAACYGYGVLGGVLAGIAAGGPDDARATAAYEEHRRQRDALAEQVRASGGDPVAAEPAYDLPAPRPTLSACRRVARQLESRCAAVYAFAAAASTGEARLDAARQLAACAVREQAWGGALEAFPGLPR